MSKSGILDALRDEEKSLRTQLVAIQRAIDAIAGADAPAPVGRGSKQARKVAAKRERAMRKEQRQAVAERMRKYWASRQRPRPRSNATCAVCSRPRALQPSSTACGDSGRAARIGRSLAFVSTISAGQRHGHPVENEARFGGV